MCSRGARQRTWLWRARPCSKKRREFMATPMGLCSGVYFDPPDRWRDWRGIRTSRTHLTYVRQRLKPRSGFPDFAYQVRSLAAGVPQECPYALFAKDFLHRAARANVVFSNPEYDGIDEEKFINKHQLLDFCIVATVPIFAREEGQTNFDFTNVRVTAVIAALPISLLVSLSTNTNAD